MFKKIKKIGSVVLGLSVIGIVSVGLHSSFTYQAGHADTPAPQRPDLALNIGDTPAPADNKGDCGGSPAENRGDTWSPSHAHGDTGSPAYNHGRPLYL
ncbi:MULTISPECIES: Phr family secreted Rap phosphatase inhibitor [Bacillus]|uniref:Phr family secreted Rap phosphatase inhibitor n=1 Tax=Bacillus TaxID=1386 RepID=UPI000381607A|nr:MULTISPECIES: Phr family secreted Rap phosphatase inhibitor [Bacillus]PEP59969.1 Phr family secreted Rap phosphatase inhibitor [Bacillus pseudomycoides]PHC95080.1 Phr family secreted Rap phosphatase inhibitor [Bacillus pseudomycoides]